MTYTIEVPWFNPRQMDDNTVQALSTNQEQLHRAIKQAVAQRAKTSIAGIHWLVTGPRGAGKSFFLRSVKAFSKQWQEQNISYILLPEELRNIFSPHEFLNEVRYLMSGDQIQSDDYGTVATWRQTDSSEQWQSALTALLNASDSKLIVIGVENFDQLLNRAFDDDIKSSHLRTMLENEPRIMLIATAVEGSFDEDYNSRLFCQFEHHPILAWTPKAHRDYLTRRANLKGLEPQPNQLARIDAYSRFTGGNARVAAVLASLLLEKQDPLNASLDLENTLDKMTDYYRAQLDRIPDKSSKLFDALIRGGEPCSQTQLAKRVQATQSDIAKAFNWLVTYGYVIGEKYQGEKATSYRVNDRLFCQFYRMRHLRQQNNNKLTILTDLLADTLLFNDKWQYAHKYSQQGLDPEARTMIELGLDEKNINLSKLPTALQQTDELIALGRALAKNDGVIDNEEFMMSICDQFDNDAEFITYVNQLKAAANASNQSFGKITATELVQSIDSSKNPLFVKAFIYQNMLTNESNEDWQAVLRMMREDSQLLGQVLANQDLNTIEKQQPLSICLLCSSILIMHNCLKDEASTNIDIADKYLRGLNYLKRAIQPLPNHSLDALNELVLAACFIQIKAIFSSDFTNSKHYKILLKINRLITKTVTSDFYYGYLAQFARILNKANRNIHALRLLNQALTTAIKQEDEDAILELYNAIAEIQASNNNFNYIINHIPKDNFFPFSVYYSVLSARCITTLKSFELGWQQLKAHFAQYPTEDNELIMDRLRKFTPVVLDYCRHRSTSEAFTLANQLFANILDEPSLPNEASTRAVWIQLIEMGVPLELLTDIVSEQQQIAPKPLQPLIEVITLWIDYLKIPASEREAYSRQLSPDVAASFKAIGQELSNDAKALYGIENSDS